MELALRLALTAAIITALILIAGRFGERVAGLLSGLPFTTAPALLLIGQQRSTVAAAEAALGGVVGCALASLFALAYFAAAGRLSRLATLVFAIGCLTAGLAAFGQLQPSLAFATTLACGCSAVALRLIGKDCAGIGRASPRVRQSARSALAIGITSAVVTAMAAGMPAWLAGVVASMPIIGVATVAACHRTHGLVAVPGFLRAYVLSSLVKASFCATFALCVIAQGVAVALMSAGLIGVVAGAAMLGLGTRMSRFQLNRRPPRSTPSCPT